MGSAAIVLFVITVILASLTIYGRMSGSKIRADRSSYLRSTLSSVPGFSVDSYVFSSDFARILAVDNRSKRVCLIKARLVASDNSDRVQNITSQDSTHFSGFTRLVDAQDILSVEIEEDNDLPLSMRPNAVGRAIAGGVIAGPAGAVVGAMTSGSRGAPTTAAKRIDLKVMVSDINSPLLLINLLNKPKRDASRERGVAQQWQARVKALVHLAKVDASLQDRRPIE